MSKHYPEIDFSTDISFTQFRSWALRLTSPLLLDSLNIWLKDTKKSPEFQKLKTKYYKKKDNKNGRQKFSLPFYKKLF